MSIISLTGTVTVSVDEVDVEQISITQKKIVEGFSDIVKAMIAALSMEDVISIQRQIFKEGYSLEYSHWAQHAPDSKYPIAITFDIIKRKTELLEDSDVG